MSGYASGFKRIPVTQETGEKIKFIQAEFDKFWCNIHRIIDDGVEKRNAMQRMQESCMWATRAAAEGDAKPQAPMKRDISKNNAYAKPYIAKKVLYSKDDSTAKVATKITIKKKKI